MADETHRLEVARSDREAFVLCLALGTLEGHAWQGFGPWRLASGHWDARCSGTHSLTLMIQSLRCFSPQMNWMHWPNLGGHTAAEAALDRMIDVIRARLSASPNKSWYARWSDETEA